MKTQMYKASNGNETEFKAGYTPRLSSGKIGEITINLQITIDTLYNIKAYCGSSALVPNDVLNDWLTKCNLPIQPIQERKHKAQADKTPTMDIYSFYKTLTTTKDKLSVVFDFANAGYTKEQINDFFQEQKKGK
jgi:hypothetical protein